MQIENCEFNSSDLADRMYKLSDILENTYFEPHYFSVHNVAFNLGNLCYLALSGENNAYEKYFHGADLFAKFLGFKNYLMFLKWAGENPDLWGNRAGNTVFSKYSYLAFGKHSNKDKVSLIDVAEHLRTVAHNLEKLK